MNLLQKKCPNDKCNSPKLDCLGCLIIPTKTDKGTSKKSFTSYGCPVCHQRFLISRDKAEQLLTQKYIDASKINLD